MGSGEKKRLLDYDHATLPEEKLMTYGAEALSDSELLALFLRTGTTGRTAIEVAQDIIDSLEGKSPTRQGLSSLFTGTYDDFLSVKGIGKSKAARLVGMVEMARRMRRPMGRAVPLNTPKAIADFVTPDLMGLQHEEFRVIGLNVKKSCSLWSAFQEAPWTAPWYTHETSFKGQSARNAIPSPWYIIIRRATPGPLRKTDALPSD